MEERRALVTKGRRTFASAVCPTPNPTSSFNTKLTAEGGNEPSHPQVIHSENFSLISQMGNGISQMVLKLLTLCDTSGSKKSAWIIRFLQIRREQLQHIYMYSSFEHTYLFGVINAVISMV